jgi:hypothetical protein
MRVRPLFLALALLLATVALAATACGGSDENAAGTTKTTTTTTTGTTSTETTTGGESTTETTGEESTESTETTETTGTGGSTSGGQTTGAGVKLASVAFRTAENTVVCGLKSRGGKQVLVCVRPENGATVTLGPAAVPVSSVIAANRGVPPAARNAPVLVKGTPMTVDVYRCTLVKGAVRCQNQRRHGFELDKLAVYRF